MALGLDDVLGIAELGLDIYTGYSTVRAAQETADIQTRELRRQQAIERARVKRETRIRKAQLLASQGTSGARLSTVASGVIGLETSLEAGLTDLDTQVGSQIQQFNLAASQTGAQAVVNTLSNITTFAATDMGKKGIDFTKNLFTDSVISDESVLPATTFTEPFTIG